MNTDLDVRVADALFDAASSTPTNHDGLSEILRRADHGRKSAGRRVALIGASAGVALVGTAGVVVMQPGRSEAPGSNEVTQAAITPTTLPSRGTVPGPLLFDDATLLSMLYVNFDAGEATDESRVFGDGFDQAQLARCMQERGFQYQALPTRDEAIATDPRQVMPPADFAAQYGFGGAAAALGMLPPEFPEDPNAEFHTSLSASEQEVFDQAEQDCFTEQVERGDVVVPDEAWGAAADFARAQFEPIVHSDDRVVEALTTWRECMSAAGFDYEDPAAIASTFGVRLYEFGPWSFPVDPGTPEYDEIEQLMAEEIAVATANVRCVEPYTDTLREVIVDRFDEYKVIFEAALAAGVESDGAGWR